jgi:hypothetical protein
MQTLNLRFASVDIIKPIINPTIKSIAKTDSGNYQILEINPGVTLDRFASQTTDNYRVAKEIYRAAILKML